MKKLRGLAFIAVLLASAVSAFAQGLSTERFQNRDVASREIIVRFRTPGDAAERSRALRTEDPDIASTAPIGRAGAVWVRSRNRDVQSLIKAYASRPDVAYVEPNYVWTAADIPNDILFNEQWALRNTGQNIPATGISGADIEAVEAWDIAEGSRGIVVGIIDSGIKYDHPDLVKNVWSAPTAFSVMVGGKLIQCAAGTHGFNAITRTCDPMDDDGHGTHTAGVIGASGNSALGVSGVSRVASLMGLKFLDPTGQGSTADAIAAIEFAIEVKRQFPIAANIRVLNASWGGGPFSQALRDEIALAGARDMLFVTAAGNLGVDIDVTPQYPAAYSTSNLIAVAATDNRDQRASFSNFGAGKVHLGAPGVEISATTRDSFTGYGRQTGTSSSAAMVSGAAALVLSACGVDTAALKSILLESVDSVPTLSGVTVTGGRLNVNTAIRSCAGSQSTFTLTAPTSQTIAFGTGNQIAMSVNAVNGFAGSVALSATNLPAGMTVGFSPAVLSNGPVVMNVSTDSGVAQGTYFVEVTAGAGSLTRTATIMITLGVPTACSISPGVGSLQGRLDLTDAASIHRPPAFADYCTFTLSDTRAVTIEMSGAFTAHMYLLSSSGQVIASDSGVSSGTRISVELTAGTYTIEATSENPGVVGNYTLRVLNTVPTVSSISPTTAMAGTTIDLTIQGTAFVGSVGLNVSSCVGVTVHSINVINSTTAVARLTLPGIFTTCAIGVSTPSGTSSTQSLRVFLPPVVLSSVSPIMGVQGQTVTLTLTGTNFISPATVRFLGPTGTSFDRTPTTVTSTSATVTWNISTLEPTGQHRILVLTEGGQSNQVTFDVTVAPPALTQIFPLGTGRGMSLTVNLHGVGLVAPLQVDAGPDITVTNININNFMTATATFTVSPTAAIGDHTVRISTALGSSNAVVFKVVPPPSITGFSPGRAFIGGQFSPRTTSITLTGTNLICGGSVAVAGGTGVSGFVSGCTDTSARLELTVENIAPLGPRQLTITFANGVANTITIDITLPAPGISTITPGIGAQGTTVTIVIRTFRVSLSGSPTVEVSGGGVTATTLSWGPDTLTASLSIAPNAAIGPRELAINSASGLSDFGTFTVTPPTWPDLTVIVNLAPVLASGYEESIVVGVRNVGTKESTTPITLKTEIHSSEALISTSGEGWSCTLVQNRFLTCTNPNSVAVNGESVLTLVIRMSDGSGGYSFGMEVTSDEDYNPANNKGSRSATVRTEPTPVIVLSSGSLEPGQQATISLNVTAFPRELNDPMNLLTVTFVPSTSGAPMDPAVQFATGGRQVSFVIRANATTAEFQGLSGPLGFQAGTVAGTLTFRMTFRNKAGQIKTATAIANVARRPPTVTRVAATKNTDGFETAITLHSSPREVATLRLHFNLAQQVRMSCGNIPGCTVFGTIVTFNVSSLFSDWYAGNNDHGTLAMIRIPFLLDSSIKGTVLISTSNAMGSSNVMTLQLP